MHRALFLVQQKCITYIEEGESELWWVGENSIISDRCLSLDTKDLTDAWCK